MGKIYQLCSVQKIPTTLEKAWSFFSDPENLLRITPGYLNLKMTNDLSGTGAYTGQIITYSVKPIMSIPIFWVTEIRHVEALKMFVDEQKKGPFHLWRHQHHFQSIEGGVEMTDIIHYSLPLGILGRFANGLVVKKKLREIFAYRYRKVNELMGVWDLEAMKLKFS